MRVGVAGALVPYLEENGEIFRVFDQQDSGCISYGWKLPRGERRFVKYTEDGQARGWLETAIRFSGEIRAACHPELRDVLETEAGLALVYDWVAGEVLNSPEFAGPSGRRNPGSSHYRFVRLPLSERLAVLETIYRFHVLVEARGWVSEDFYDGSVIYDFQGKQTHLCDLDNYHPGPYVLNRERAYGSSRFLAPEELSRGSRIDTRTMVYIMGRTAMVFLSDGDRDGSHWQAPASLLEVVLQACRERPEDRFPSVAELTCVWAQECRNAGLLWRSP